MHQAVDAECDRVLVEEQQITAGTDGGCDAAHPRVEVARLHHRPRACVDEVEAPTTKLAGQDLRVRLHPEDRRPSAPRELERLPRRVDTGDDRTELCQLGCRLARRAAQVQHALAGQIREGVHRRRQSGLAGERVGPLAMDVVPGAPVVVGRLHQARSE